MVAPVAGSAACPAWIARIIAAAEAQFGETFSQVVAVSNVWLNGDPVEPDALVNDGDEVAVIPPVSGG
jgi:molybdopterin converting factor small subunit